MTELTARATVTVAEQRRALNDPRERLARLLDPGTLNVTSNLPGSRVAVARGRINGVAVVAYCTDARSLGGAIGSLGARQIVDVV